MPTVFCSNYIAKGVSYCGALDIYYKPCYNNFIMSETIRSDKTWVLSYPDIFDFLPNPDLVSRTTKGEFEHQDISKFTRLPGDGLMLESGILSRLTDDGKTIIEATFFEHHDAWSVGREDSVHGVEFGTLGILASNGRMHEMPVAIKPFHLFRSGASNEAAALLKVPEITSIDSFELVGLIRSNGVLALITRFEEDVVSLDNVNWDMAIEASVKESFNVIEALQKCALLLARMHQCEIVHNDAQVKNMAVARNHAGGAVLRLVDLENTKWRNTKDEPERQRYLDGIHSDVGALIGSILAKGLWRNADYTDKARAIEILFTEPYLSYLSHPSNRDDTYTPELHNEVEERVDDVLQQI